MALSSEQIYDELNGAEVKEILLTRMLELLSTVPDFQKHLTLPRVRMRLQIHLDIFGRRNPALDLSSELTLRTRQPDEEMTLAKEMVAEDEFSADTGVPVPDTPFDGGGQPPDQIREEHNLPMLEPVKDRAGITQQRPLQPVPLPAVGVGAQPTPALPGGRRYAAFHTLERAGPAIMGYREYLPGKEPIAATPSQPREKPTIGIQRDFRDAHRPNRGE
jgi:hypothetical protein